MSVRLEIRPGVGTIARRGEVVAWVSDDVHPALRDGLLGLLGTPGGPEGRALVRRVAGLLIDADDQTSRGGFAVLAREGRILAALLHGPVSLVSEHGDRLTGLGSPTWVDAEIPLGGSLAIGPGSPDDVQVPDSSAALPTDLRDGLVAGGGVVVHVVPDPPVPPGTETAPVDSVASPPDQPAGGDATNVGPAGPPQTPVAAPPGPPPPVDPAEPAGPADPTDPGASFRRPDGAEFAPPAYEPPAPSPPPAYEPQPQAYEPPTQPAPPPYQQPGPPPPSTQPAAPPPAAPEPAPGPGMVTGVVCPQGHFNDPRWLYCVVCSYQIPPQQPQLGPRPSLGSLVLDDGSLFGLDLGYVIGRAPEVAEAVQAGYVRPLAVPDPDHLISRAHFEVRLEDWDVVVADLGSANGTFIWNQGDADWARLVPHQGVVLRLGGQVAFGKRSLSYEPPHAV